MSFQTSSVQSLSHVQFFVTPCTAANQASLSITNSWSLLKLISIESVMPSSHLILCHPLLLPPSIFPSISVFSKPGLPLWLSWSRIRLQCGRPGFDPWIGKIPWRRERLPTPGFLPGPFRGPRSRFMGSQSQTQLSNYHCTHFHVRSCLQICGNPYFLIIKIERLPS